MKKFQISFFLSLILSNGALFGQTPLKTHTVSIFKNGTAFFVRAGEVELEEGRFRIEEQEIPRALFGSFWFHAPGQQNYSVRRIQDTIRKQKPIEHLLLYPQENIGKRVRIQTNDTWYDGLILSASREMMVLKHNDFWMSIPTKQISLIQFFDNPVAEYESKSVQNSLILDFDKNTRKQELEMMYLQRGIGWFPTYLLELEEEDKARLTFRAEIINDAEDLEETNINFVVGVPNFRYAGIAETPLVSGMDIDHMLAMLASGSGRSMPQAQVFSNSFQGFEYGIDQDLNPSFSPTPVNTASEGSSLEDLYFYQLENISLPKGGRAYYNILTAEVPVAHIYECQLPANNASFGYYNQLEARSKYHEVIHKLKIQNNTEQPFTTGAAFVSRIVKGVSNPISQDQLPYTPVGGESFLKITTSPDVQVSHQEEEVEVEENVRKENRTTYDLVTIKGSVTVKNYKAEEIDLNVRRMIVGNLLESDPDWLESVRVNLNRTLNATTDVCWELKLAAGEEKIVNYQYQVYVAN